MMKRRMMALAVVAGLLFSLITVPTRVKAAIKIEDPVIQKSTSLQAGKKVTYDTVYLGSYPQAEVIASGKYMEAVEPDMRNGADFIVDASLYKKLENANWKNDETTIDGERYRRMTMEDATYAVATSEDVHKWYSAYFWWLGSPSTYRYFKYQPIKWRVLDVSGDEALLLADQVLDCRKYHERYENVTWETSTLRTFLNDEFYQTVFSKDEQNAIVDSALENANNTFYRTNGGNDTMDKVFILSSAELTRSTGEEYGFANYYDCYDEARLAQSSTYAKAMGLFLGEVNDERGDFRGYCDWWVRMPGQGPRNTVICWYVGYVEYEGQYAEYDKAGVRPALRLDLSAYNPTYAGTVCTNGTVKTASEVENQKEQEITLPAVKTYSAVKLGKKKASFSLNAETSGNGKLTYKVTKGSSKCITVNKTGKVTLKKGCPAGIYQVTITAAKTSRVEQAKKVINIHVK